MLVTFDKPNYNAKKKIPIVALPGWLSYNAQLFLLKKRLEKLGYRVYLPKLGLQLGKIENLSEKLSEYLQKHNIDQFIFIGHSLGGIIGMHYYCNNKATITKFIALGTPFYGTNFARHMFLSPSIAQIKPNSEFLKTLHKRKITMNQVYSIATLQDGSVPIKSTKLARAHHITVNVHGHNTLIYSKTVFDEIAKILK